MTTPEIQLFVDADALADGAAALVASRLDAACRRGGRADIALAGGSTPRAMYRHLATRDLAWPRVHVYFGDERCVPPGDAASNYRMACQSLLDHVPAEVHRIEGELDPATAAARYGELLATQLPFDVVVLGMGDDGHTASLFPDTPDPPDGALAIATRSPVAPHDRVTLTYRALGQAGTRVLLVSGASKAARLAEIHHQLAAGRPTLPAARVAPTIWMIDEAAATELPKG